MDEDGFINRRLGVVLCWCVGSVGWMVDLMIRSSMTRSLEILFHVQRRSQCLGSCFFFLLFGTLSLFSPSIIWTTFNSLPRTLGTDWIYVFFLLRCVLSVPLELCENKRFNNFVIYFGTMNSWTPSAVTRMRARRLDLTLSMNPRCCTRNRNCSSTKTSSDDVAVFNEIFPHARKRFIRMTLCFRFEAHAWLMVPSPHSASPLSDGPYELTADLKRDTNCKCLIH